MLALRSDLGYNLQVTQEPQQANRNIRYEADDRPPLALTAGLGVQFAILAIAGIVLTPAIVIRAAGGAEEYLTWAVFAAAVVSGISTILQAVRLGRIGSGYVLLMGTSGAFIAVCVTALQKGGPGLLATLVVASSLFQFLLAAKLSLFRRLLTPTVSGTVVMLIAVTVMPLVFDMVASSPEGRSAWSAPASALTAMGVIVVIALVAKGGLRLWAPVVGIAAGSVVASLFGIYDTDRVADAAWIGLPDGGWPGYDLGFGGDFWGLLPAFVFVTLIGAVETIGDSVAIQRVSWRRPRAVDFRAVQGAVAADGTGNLLSGLAGTMPNTTYSTSISLTELTGVAARRVGVVIGVSFVVMAFVPKVLALVLAIPEAVVAAYITVLLALLFVVGMRMVIDDANDYRRSLIAGVAFWIGVGFQNGDIFGEYLDGFAGGFLANGMTAGGLTAIVLTLFTEFTGSRSLRLHSELSVDELPRVHEFLADFADRNGWGVGMRQRLDMVAEETLLTLLDNDGDGLGGSDGGGTAGGSEDFAQRMLRLTAKTQDGRPVLEFVAAGSDENLEDRLSVLTAQSTELPLERDISLRMLRHYSSNVHHQQYHDLDIVTVHVKPPDHADNTESN